MAISQTSRQVYSEDDNFLIGDDFMSERLRREARQLHLSKFPRVRREAHFARYRNSFLKCDLYQTNDRIEQERKLRLAEIESAQAAILNQSRKKTRRGSQEIVCEKNTGTGLINARTRNGSREVGDKDSQGFLRSTSTMSSSLAENSNCVESQENTIVAKPRLQVTSSMSFNRDTKIAIEDEKTCQGTFLNEKVDFKLGNLDEKPSRAKVRSSPSFEATTEDNLVTNEDISPRLSIVSRSRASSLSKDCNFSRNLDGGISDATSSPSPLARKRYLAETKELPNLAASSASRASSVAGKRLSVAVSSPSRSPSVMRRREVVGTLDLLNIPTSTASRASSVAGKRNSVAVSSPSRSSAVAERRDLAGTQDVLNIDTYNSSRASSRGEKRHSIAISSPSRLSAVAKNKARTQLRVGVNRCKKLSAEKHCKLLNNQVKKASGTRMRSSRVSSAVVERGVAKIPSVQGTPSTNMEDKRKYLFASRSVVAKNVDISSDDDRVMEKGHEEVLKNN